MIIVAGEALIDLVPAGPLEADGPADDDLPALLPKRGGGPYNTAVALARLGSPTAFCSRLSTDHFGQALLSGLGADGVDTSLVQRGPEPTTLAVAHVGDDGSAEYSFHVEGAADRLFTSPDSLPEAARAISFGTCSLVLEPGASAYEDLMRRASARGLFTALDPNIRPGLIPDAAAYRARFRSWLPHVTLLKLSEEDAAWLAGPEGGDPMTAAREWPAAGPYAVVLTRGGAGLTVLTRDGLELSVPGEQVTVVDTIGAGDTVNAALLHRLDSHGALTASPALEAHQWRDILAFAARAAAITCSRAGARPPYADELVMSPAGCSGPGAPTVDVRRRQRKRPVPRS
ncbi:carbohydrate kinase [Streptomyces sp. AV19]|uniref:carbohydrate kinase family protein n=1 Tax=Streptomyces sp. AV19 TaxID=2793068 RepID=UPI0018FE2D3D|nr:carbohydrate kinase [Streptomyces sp. AV19]MBH1935829.1 carbohydrate kinase [Streptomyces sp. AV19]MDG4534028.1 carbohydrate kinase [Streptomyces sp. AV19]